MKKKKDLLTGKEWKRQVKPLPTDVWAEQELDNKSEEKSYH